MREKNQVVFPLDLEIRIPEGDFVFKVAEICEGERIIEATFPLIKTPTSKIHLRAIGKGKPEIQELEYENRNCKAITVFDKICGQF